MNPLIIPILQIVAIVGILTLLMRRGPRDRVTDQLADIEKAQERIERSLRDEMARGREEGAGQARQLREEIVNGLRTMADIQKTQLQAFADLLQQTTVAGQNSAKQLREEVTGANEAFSVTMSKRIGEMANGQEQRLDSFAKQIEKLTESNEKRHDALRLAVEERLKALQDDNTKKLDQMRETVDTKLQSTLEQRLGESFKLVSDRLEQVHKGLGEMQTLANGVGDLKRVLTNVKTRGTWGEVQLGSLLDQVLAPTQYERNVQTKTHSAERVDFAIRLPGREEGGEEVWLPIDAKFPQEEYQRLVEAQERGDLEAMETASKLLEIQFRKNAQEICDKYINPPLTTDFAIMFLPTEGLYAEFIRRAGTVEAIQRDCKVTIAGPTTLLALLNALQMGFRSLAIQKRSSEVWQVLGAVKTEFQKYGDVLDKVQKKLHEATDTIDKVNVRNRAIQRRLRNVEVLPDDAARAILMEGDTRLDAFDEGEPDVVSLPDTEISSNGTP